jgi:hypothetical protein
MRWHERNGSSAANQQSWQNNTGMGGGVGMLLTSLGKIEGSNPQGQGKSLRKILYQAYDVHVFLRIENLLACQK